MLKSVMKLTALAAMSLVIAASTYQFSQTAAAMQICSTTCYNSCRSAYIFCRDNPDGYWDNGYAGGPCSEFSTIDFCCKWECPNTTSTNSKCMFNPTLPGCAYGTSPTQTYCNSDQRLSCVSLCNTAVDRCQHGGRCASAVVSGPSAGSQSCTCSYTVECF